MLSFANHNIQCQRLISWPHRGPCLEIKRHNYFLDSDGRSFPCWRARLLCLSLLIFNVDIVIFSLIMMMIVKFDCSTGRNQLNGRCCQSLELHYRRQQRLIPTSTRSSDRRGSQRVQAFQLFERFNARYLQRGYLLAISIPKVGSHLLIILLSMSILAETRQNQLKVSFLLV